MALKKLKPLSPDIYLGKTVGDNELARLAHVNDIVSKYRKILEFDVPNVDDVINIYPNHVETIVLFNGILSDKFTINVIIDPRFSPNLEPGDKMYIFLEGTGTFSITFSGAISVTQCGEEDNSFTPTDPVCLEVIYNGNQFIGIDVC